MADIACVCWCVSESTTFNRMLKARSEVLWFRDSKKLDLRMVLLRGEKSATRNKAELQRARSRLTKSKSEMVESEIAFGLVWLGVENKSVIREVSASKESRRTTLHLSLIGKVLMNLRSSLFS